VVCGHIHHAEMRDDRRRAVLQRRRLGRKPHRAGRAPDGRLEIIGLFTIPKDEYGVLLGLKQRAGTLAHHAKKSEILRAGVQLLSALPDARFLAALVAVPSLKTGRPKQELAVPAVQGSKKQGR
jgi:hypothetical protein